MVDRKHSEKETEQKLEKKSQGSSGAPVSSFGVKIMNRGISLPARGQEDHRSKGSLIESPPGRHSLATGQFQTSINTHECC